MHGGPSLDEASADAPPCGRCGGTNVHRSKIRGGYERFRRLHTPTRPFRCHDCGWRGWRLPLERVTPLGDLNGGGFHIPDTPLQQLAVGPERPRPARGIAGGLRGSS
jgi:hypothetical protein